MQNNTPDTQTGRLRGLASVALAGLIWGSIPLVVNSVGGASVVKVFFRVAFAAAAIAAVMVFTGRWREILALPRAKWMQLIGQGLVLTLNWYLFLTSFELTKVATAELLGYLGPVFVALLGPMISRERFDRRIMVPIGLALIGMIVILAPQGLSVTSPRERIGALLAFGSALTYATLLLRSKKILAGVSSEALMLVEYGIASVVLAPFVLSAYRAGNAPSGTNDYLGLATLGVVHTAIAGLIFLGGIRRVRTDQAAVMTYIEPVSAVVFAAIFLSQPITLPTVIGGLLVVAGGALVTRIEAVETPPMEAALGGDDLLGIGATDDIAAAGTIARAMPGGSLARLASEDVVARLMSGDATLFAGSEGSAAERLGWIDLPAAMPALLSDCAEKLAPLTSGIRDVVLLGMGGSSLAPLVLSRVLEHPRALHVLDTNAPETVSAVIDAIDCDHTLWVVASKSGSTVEPRALYAIFRARADAELGREAAGGHFIAITDPGTSLAALAHAEGFGAVLASPENVGGRFSALSVFGAAPLIAAGADLSGIAQSARLGLEACSAPATESPAAELAAFIVDAWSQGRDKLHVVCDPEIESLGLWIEQLVAESLGKDGIGVVPILDSAPSPDSRDGVLVMLTGPATHARRTIAGEIPVLHLLVEDPEAIGAQFVIWETAVALAGHLLGVNPFDQEDVTAAKDATSAVLAGNIVAPAAIHTRDGVSVRASGMDVDTRGGALLADTLRGVLAAVRPGDHLALLAYLPDDEHLLSELRDALATAGTALGVATDLHLGPRYLHSTGQLHKGGSDAGTYLILTAPGDIDLDVPGMGFSLRALNRAQAEGDFIALSARGRRVAWLDLAAASAESLALVSDALTQAARARS